jgi:hypothetical protein
MNALNNSLYVKFNYFIYFLYLIRNILDKLIHLNCYLMPSIFIIIILILYNKLFFII